jgi:tyrosinase
LPSRSDVRKLRDYKTYRDFHSQLETTVHNQIHMFVGGTMMLVEWSAYDPLFWVHHANVDRLWYLWQIGANGVDPDVTILDQPLPLGKEAMTVRQTLDISAVGYEYMSAAASVAGNRRG